MEESRAFMLELKRELSAVPSPSATSRFAQSLDYPTVNVYWWTGKRHRFYRHDSPSEIARSVVAATSSTRFIVQNYWPDPEARDRLSGAGGDSAISDDSGPRTLPQFR